MSDETLSITCPDCGRTSYNLNDVVNVYCGACHAWLPSATVPPAVRMEALGMLREMRKAELEVDLFAPENGDGH